MPARCFPQFPKVFPDRFLPPPIRYVSGPKGSVPADPAIDLGTDWLRSDLVEDGPDLEFTSRVIAAAMPFFAQVCHEPLNDASYWMCSVVCFIHGCRTTQGDGAFLQERQVGQRMWGASDRRHL
ncbi:hypothetical protein BV898_04369 [Hypsibius exemplaris]|uniref:Uncharacterized protein n=1 Tax=Hypsibius exemplaris TaxID=2072580 RepID=A0A1W0X3A2_HYPEX|nr:hypothetical protein BV898_04369 [Hypsibius exemplaris]